VIYFHNFNTRRCMRENVRNRLAKYDVSDAPLRALFPNTSQYVNGRAVQVHPRLTSSLTPG